MPDSIDVTARLAEALHALDYMSKYEVLAKVRAAEGEKHRAALALAAAVGVKPRTP